jgi:hypothetical protein
MKDRLVGEESTFTVETTQGRFTFSERADGSLSIHESGHGHLAIFPKTANAIELHVTTPAAFHLEAS